MQPFSTPFLYPFQGVEKGCIGSKWVKLTESVSYVKKNLCENFIDLQFEIFTYLTVLAMKCYPP